MEYAIDTKNEHIIVEINGIRALIDTGSPMSFSDVGSFSLLGKAYPLQNNPMGLTATSLSDSIGTRVDALIGTDILKQASFLVDWVQKKIVFSDDNIDEKGIIIPLSNFRGIPIVNIKIADEDARVFFDTGAKLSYVMSSMITQHEVIERVEDFYPGFGTFSTDVSNIPMSIGGENFEMKFGVLPTTLESMLTMGNVQGILGNEIFNHFNRIAFSVGLGNIILIK